MDDEDDAEQTYMERPEGLGFVSEGLSISASFDGEYGSDAFPTSGYMRSRTFLYDEYDAVSERVAFRDLSSSEYSSLAPEQPLHSAGLNKLGPKPKQTFASDDDKQEERLKALWRTTVQLLDDEATGEPVKTPSSKSRPLFVTSRPVSKPFTSYGKKSRQYI